MTDRQQFDHWRKREYPLLADDDYETTLLWKGWQAALRTETAAAYVKATLARLK